MTDEGRGGEKGNRTEKEMGSERGKTKKIDWKLWRKAGQVEALKSALLSSILRLRMKVSDTYSAFPAFLFLFFSPKEKKRKASQIYDSSKSLISWTSSYHKWGSISTVMIWRLHSFILKASHQNSYKLTTEYYSMIETPVSRWRIRSWRYQHLFSAVYSVKSELGTHLTDDWEIVSTKRTADFAVGVSRGARDRYTTVS